MNQYVEHFLKLNCAGDVLNSVSPMKRPEQHITEAMAILKRLRPIVLAEPNKFKIVEVTSGNGLASVVALHLFPIVSATIFSTKAPNRLIERVKNLTYYNRRFKYDTDKDLVDKNTIIIMSGCILSQDAEIVDAYLENESSGQFIAIPENGHFVEEDHLINKCMGKYAATCMHIRNILGGKMTQDRYILGPRNIVIVA